MHCTLVFKYLEYHIISVPPIPSLVSSPPPSFSVHTLESLGTRLPSPHAHVQCSHYDSVSNYYAQHFQILKIPSFGPFWHKSISPCRAPISSVDCQIFSYARSAFYEKVLLWLQSHNVLMMMTTGRGNRNGPPRSKQPCCFHTHPHTPPCPTISVHAERGHCRIRYYSLTT